MTGSRQRRLVFQIMLQGAPGREGSGQFGRREAEGEAYKTRAGAGRPRGVAEQLTRVPPARSPNRQGEPRARGSPAPGSPRSSPRRDRTGRGRGRGRGRWAGAQEPRPLRIPSLPRSVPFPFWSWDPRQKKPDYLPPPPPRETERNS